MFDLLLAGLAAAPLGGDPPTFTRDVAPILYRRCAGCHRPGESTPFSLLTYRDVAKRARMVARVTRTRYMPPWLPRPGHGEFAGTRRLDEAEIDTLQRWAAAGAPEGDPADLPDAPDWAPGWSGGEPDLVLQLAEPYELVAEGPDQFRNFVVPVPLEATQFVATVEIRPGTKTAVHHGILQIDPLRATRRLDAETPEPGFPGMTMGSSEPPDGHFIGWTPGKLPQRSPPHLAWRLQRGADLVLQLHMIPTGKVERVQPRIGFYFTDRAPTGRMFPVELFSEEIDIAAGAADHRVRDRYTLPCDVKVHKVYPHAHYLCRQMIARATLPDGTVRPLLRIDDWNFDWQDEYTYREPLALPAGTVLEYDYGFDNTAANPRNPHQPPQRVLFGQESTDEMATMTLQVEPVRFDDVRRLDEARWRHTLQKKPWDYYVQTRLANVLIETGRVDEAVGHLREALQRKPDDAYALCTLAVAAETSGYTDDAEGYYRRAIEIDATHHIALSNLGRLLSGRGELEEAVAILRRAVDAQPNFVAARVNLGNALGMSGDPEASLEQYEAALAVEPDSHQALSNMASSLLTLQRVDPAIAYLRRALAVRPDYFSARFNLGRALLFKSEWSAAAVELERALALRPDFAPARQALDAARERAGR